MTSHVIVGTAGHIDHGKTTLVKALTGVDADRLPEEKRRGMTVDLGFASLDLDELRLGIVDVPGHDRFIRNMLCGALAIDVAMLVVAATESVKPQTREHLEILQHTGIEQGVVVLSKCDLADPQWIAMVEEEVRELLAPTFLHAAPLVRVSAISGAGIAELQQELAAAARRSAASSRRALVDAPFCMGVDRAFSVDGHGTVATGSVASGRLRVGDEVVIRPSGVAARVRGLQSHGAAVDAVERGQRAAVNLAGVPLRSIRRGDVLASEGLVTASRSFAARLTIAPQHSARVRQKMPVRVHLGTADVQASLRMLERPREGEEVIAELLPSEQVACVAGQPLVIRSHCATTTLGGGRVLDPDLPPHRRWSATDINYLRRLAASDPAERVAAAIYLNALAGFEPRLVARRIGPLPPPENSVESLLERGEVERFDLPGEQHHYLHARIVERLIERVEQLLEKQHQRNPLRAAFPRSVLQKIFEPDGAAGLRDAVLVRMEQAGRLVMMPAGVALPGHAPQLSKAQQREYARIIQRHRDAGSAPPSAEQLVADAKSNRDAVTKLIELAVAEGHLVRVCDDWCLHWEIERQMLETLRDGLGATAFTVSDLRDLLHTSRKYLVPICEYLDRIGFTARDGDLRTIVPAQLREDCCT